MLLCDYKLTLELENKSVNRTNYSTVITDIGITFNIILKEKVNEVLKECDLSGLSNIL